MELLAPAGNIEKLKYAYAYGADAAYIGVRSFSLRTRADNFHQDEHRKLKAVKGRKKLYGALNIFFHNSDIKEIEQALEYIALYPFDAFIISDLGILRLLQNRFPHTDLHLSTQANCLNSEAAKLYQDLGFSRIVLARETSLYDIEQIKQAAPDLELEAFVHGAMCVAYSGRCLLSSYMSGRSANQGDCAHSCRWDYRVLEEQKRPGEYYPIESGEGFTALLSSRDICMIDRLQDLRNAGVDSLKIEGRMKSLYYTAVVTRAYRKALDHPDNPDCWKPYRDDLFKVSHREYSTGFYYGSGDMNTPALKSYQREYLFLGTLGAPVKAGWFQLDLKNQIIPGEEIEFITPDIPFQADSGYQIHDEEGNPVSKADHGKFYLIRPSVDVPEGSVIRKRMPPPS